MVSLSTSERNIELLRSCDKTKERKSSLFNLWMILFAAPQLILLQVVPRALAAPYLGSIHRERKRILIEPKSMSARHHLALSVDHRPTPLTLSIAPPPTLSKQSPPSTWPRPPLHYRPPGGPSGPKGVGLGPSPDYETTVVTLSTVLGWWISLLILYKTVRKCPELKEKYEKVATVLKFSFPGAGQTYIGHLL